MVVVMLVLIVLTIGVGMLRPYATAGCLVFSHPCGDTFTDWYTRMIQRRWALGVHTLRTNTHTGDIATHSDCIHPSLFRRLHSLIPNSHTDSEDTSLENDGDGCCLCTSRERTLPWERKEGSRVRVRSWSWRKRCFCVL